MANRFGSGQVNAQDDREGGIWVTDTGGCRNRSQHGIDRPSIDPQMDTLAYPGIFKAGPGESPDLPASAGFR